MIRSQITSIRIYAIWIVMTLFVSYNYFLKASYGVVIEGVSKNLGVDYAAASLLSSVFFYVYAFVQLIIGLLLAHVSLRKVITFAISLTAVGTFLFAWTTDFNIAVWARIMMGAGSAFSLTSTIYLIGKLFSPSRFAFMVGLTNCVANFCGSGFGVMLFVVSGYNQQSMTIVGGVGILIAIAAWISIPNRFRDREKDPQNMGVTSLVKNFRKELLAVLSSIQMWSISLYGGIMLGVLIAFGNLWNIPFQRASGLSMEFASFMNLLIILGMASGSVAIGFFSDLTKQRLLPAFLSALGALITISLVLYMPYMSVVFKYVTLLFFGFFCGSVCLSYAMVYDYMPQSIQGMAIGFVTGITSLVGGGFQYIIGKALLLLRKGVGTVGTQFTVNQYQQALTIIPGALCIAFVLLCVISVSREYQIRIRKPVVEII